MERSAVSMLLLRLALADPTCWGGGVTHELCCDLAHGPGGNEACWDAGFTFERCCAPEAPAAPVDALEEVAEGSWPHCIVKDVILRHAGAYGFFTDMSTHGHKGCTQNVCTLTDKFTAASPAVCARLCEELDECTHWTYGEQEEPQQGSSTKCFLRKSQEGRETFGGWQTGARTCAPPRLPAAFVALQTARSEGLKACDAGKSEKCPDVHAAMTTWKFAIKYLKMVTVGRVDESTVGHVLRIAEDSQAFINSITGDYRPSASDYPRVAYNNRVIFDALNDYLAQFPGVELSEDDMSLPNPLRTGKLCGKSSCYEEVESTAEVFTSTLSAEVDFS